MARQLSADDFVSGKLTVAGDEVTIHLELYNVDSDKLIDSRSVGHHVFVSREAFEHTVP